jgi:hypothetical protein
LEPGAAPPALHQKEADTPGPLLMKVAPRDATHPLAGRVLRQDFAIAATSADGRPFKASGTALAKGDKLALRIEVAKDAYVGVWAVTADGSVVQLFPNDHEPDNRLKAGEPHAIPVPGTEGVPQGKGYIHVVASTAPWPPPHTLRRTTELGDFPAYTRQVERKELEQTVDRVVGKDGKPSTDKDAPAVSEVIFPLGNLAEPEIIAPPKP